MKEPFQQLHVANGGKLLTLRYRQAMGRFVATSPSGVLFGSQFGSDALSMMLVVFTPLR